MVVSQLIAAIEIPISPARLEAYRQGGSDLDMVTNYLWNMQLSEALYPTLQSLELALRNTIHHNARIQFGNDFWFDDPSAVPLRPNEANSLLAAKRKLRKVPKPWPIGKLVAELGFGFWTGLLQRPYDVPLWRGPANNYQLLRDCFPNAPRFMYDREKLWRRYDRMRETRNRVFHHEPIWNYNDLTQRHDQVLESIEWISPTLHTTAVLFDRFPLVYQLGWQQVESVLRVALNIS